MRKYIIGLICVINVALIVGCGEVNSGELGMPGTTNVPESVVLPVYTSFPETPNQTEPAASPETNEISQSEGSPHPPESETPCPVEITPVKVAVIDTGFSPHCIPTESVLEGKNYLYPERNCDDTYGHGTAVASIILRYAPQAFLVPLVSNAYEDGKITRVDNDTFGQMIRDAVDVYNCDIINISAGLVLDKESVREAIAYAEEKNVLVVASVGNDYELNGSAPYYPAAYDTVLAVGALNAEGTELAAFSQRGEWVDVYCIGENVTIGTLSGNTRTSDGTSYSAAKITGVAVKVLEEWRKEDMEKSMSNDAGESAVHADGKREEGRAVSRLREEILSLAEMLENFPDTP